MFGVTVQLMSDRELGRFEVLRDLDQRRLTTPAAAQLLGLERRQVFRLLKAYRAEGAAGLISKRRGGSSNRRKPEELRTKVLAIIRKRYWDFGPTLAAEKLREGHDITLGRETLRLWLQFVESEFDFRLFSGGPRLSGGLGQAGGVLQRQARGVPGQSSGGAGRQSPPLRRRGA